MPFFPSNSFSIAPSAGAALSGPDGAQDLIKKIEAGLNIHMSDGRGRCTPGTWADKMRIHGKQKPAKIGEIRTVEDLEKLPEGQRCYLVYLPSQKTFRWADERFMRATLGGSRHDFLNRGDALREKKPSRGYIKVNGGTVKVTSSKR